MKLSNVLLFASTIVAFAHAGSKDLCDGGADTPVPTSTTPAPTSTTPAPTSTTPAPTSTTPAPTSTTPAPTSTTPAPTSTTPAPTSTTPAPTATTPAPTATTPAPSPSVTTAAPTPAPSQCEAPTSGLYFGNDLTLDAWKDVTQPECCGKCAATTGCQAYTFLPNVSTTSGKGDCYAKTGTATKVSGLSNRFVSSTVKSPKTCPSPPSGLSEGQSLLCTGDNSKVYRYTCGQIRHYPDPTIAASWDPFWLTKLTTVSCAGLTVGTPMAMKPCPAQPAGVPEGLSVKCSATSDPIYRSTCGEIRHYSTPEIAASWDAAWAQPTVVNCTDIPVGVDMPKRACPSSSLGISEGQAVRCKANSNPYAVGLEKVYRFNCNEIRWYPTEAIATSWDRWWTSAVTVDCSGLAVGVDMPEKK